MSSSIITLSVIFISIALIKTGVLLIRPAVWFSFTRRLYCNPGVTRAVALLLAGIVLGVLISSGIDIVQILAVCLFMSLMLMASLAPYAPKLMAWAESQDIRQILREQAAYTLIWLGLVAWAVVVLLRS